MKIKSAGRMFLWAIAGRRAWLLAMLLTCVTALAAAELTLPWLLQLAVDSALGSKDLARLDRIGLLVLLVIVGLYFLHALSLRIEIRIVQDALFRLRKTLYTRIVEQPMPFFSRVQTGDLTHRVVNDTSVFEQHASGVFSDLPFDLITIVGVLAAMFLLEPRLAIVVTALVLVAAITSAYMGRSMPSLKDKVLRAGALFSGRLNEVFTGMRTVKVFAREHEEISKLEAHNEDIKSLEKKAGSIQALLEPLFDFIELLGIAFIIWFGARLIATDQLTAGGLIAFVAYMEMLAGPMSNGGKHYRSVVECRVVCKRIAAFLSELSTAGEGGVPYVCNTAPQISFTGVSFAYPGAERLALRKVSFDIAAGETVAITGHNGSGKSTLMDMLLEFHRPTGGKIQIDGIDLGEIDLQNWRNAVGTISQEAVLFKTSVRENIAYGRPDASARAIEKAAREAGLDPLIVRLPQGLDTIVGNGGRALSGGERQRIALARLFLKDPKVLILDEPTSFLDEDARREVARILQKLAHGRTTLLIEHHPEVVPIADRTIVMAAGRVVGFGQLTAFTGSARPALAPARAPARAPVRGREVRVSGLNLRPAATVPGDVVRPRQPRPGSRGLPSSTLSLGQLDDAGIRGEHAA